MREHLGRGWLGARLGRLHWRDLGCLLVGNRGSVVWVGVVVEGIGGGLRVLHGAVGGAEGGEEVVEEVELILGERRKRAREINRRSSIEACLRGNGWLDGGGGEALGDGGGGNADPDADGGGVGCGYGEGRDICWSGRRHPTGPALGDSAEVG